VTEIPGLFFLGLPWQHTRGSALLGFVRHDAAWLADRLAVQRASSGLKARPSVADRPLTAVS
jgi:putative flavoprotein involved in K+ transport